jgi:hypothetical protein
LLAENKNPPFAKAAMTDTGTEHAKQHDDYLVKVLTMLVIIVGSLIAFFWQDVRNNIFVLTSEVNSINRRLDVLDTANQSRAKGVDEQRDELKAMSVHLNNIEKSLIRKRVIAP